MNSQYLKWFHSIEKSLWAFFSLFNNLCADCFNQSLADIKANNRKNKENWACCIIDNQIHDNWDSLNKVQSKINPNWYKSLKKLELPRLPGNGPCPALSLNGCVLKKYRPITCTTQLCPKMLKILNKFNIIHTQTKSPLQIEDIIKLPKILPNLYGIEKKDISLNEVSLYIAEVKKLTNEFKAKNENLFKISSLS